MSRVLILGGTSEAGSLARAIAASGWAWPILSLILSVMPRPPVG